MVKIATSNPHVFTESSSGSNPTPYSGNQSASGAAKSNDAQEKASQDPEYSAKTSSSKTPSAMKQSSVTTGQASPYVRSATESPSSTAQAIAQAETKMYWKGLTNAGVAQTSVTGFSSSGMPTYSTDTPGVTKSSTVMPGYTSIQAQQQAAISSSIASSGANFSSIYGVSGVATTTHSGQQSVTLLATTQQQQADLQKKVDAANLAEQQRVESQSNVSLTTGQSAKVTYPELEIQGSIAQSSFQPGPVTTSYSDITSLSKQKITRENVDAATQSYGKYVALKQSQASLTTGVISPALTQSGEQLGTNIAAYSAKEFGKQAVITGISFGATAVIAEAIAYSSLLSKIPVIGPAGAAVVGSIPQGVKTFATTALIASFVAPEVVKVRDTVYNIGTGKSEIIESPTKATYTIADVVSAGVGVGLGIRTLEVTGGKPITSMIETGYGKYRGFVFEKTVAADYASRPKFSFNLERGGEVYIPTAKLTYMKGVLPSEYAFLEGKTIVSTEPLKFDYSGAKQRTLYGKAVTDAEVSAATESVRSQTVVAPTSKSEGVYVNPLRSVYPESGYVQKKLVTEKVVGFDPFTNEKYDIVKVSDTLKLMEGSSFKTSYEGQPVVPGSTLPKPKESLWDQVVITKTGTSSIVSPTKFTFKEREIKNVYNGPGKANYARINLQDDEAVADFRRQIGVTEQQSAGDVIFGRGEIENPFTSFRKTYLGEQPVMQQGGDVKEYAGIKALPVSDSWIVKQSAESELISFTGQTSHTVARQDTGYFGYFVGTVPESGVTQVTLPKQDVGLVQVPVVETKQLVGFEVPPVPPVPPQIDISVPPERPPSRVPPSPDLPNPIQFGGPPSGGGSSPRKQKKIVSNRPRKGYKPSILGLELGYVTPRLAKAENLTGLEIRGLPSKGGRVWSTAPPARINPSKILYRARRPKKNENRVQFPKQKVKNTNIFYFRRKVAA